MLGLGLRLKIQSLGVRLYEVLGLGTGVNPKPRGFGSVVENWRKEDFRSSCLQQGFHIGVCVPRGAVLSQYMVSAQGKGTQAQQLSEHHARSARSTLRPYL